MSCDRSTLVRSSRKLAKIFGDTCDTATQSESAWHKRKPTHLPPLLRRSDPSPSEPGSSYHRGSRTSVLSVLSNASLPSPSDSSKRRTKLHRLRRRLGDEVPASAVFPPTAVFSPTTPTVVPPSAPSTPRSSRTSRTRARSIVRSSRTDDARSVTFSISSEESVHTISFAAARIGPHSPRPRKARHLFQTGALPPVPPLPAHLTESCRATGGEDDDDAGLIRPRQKIAAGSRFGGADFKAARRTKREGGKGMAEPGEMIEMVGFLF